MPDAIRYSVLLPVHRPGPVLADCLHALRTATDKMPATEILLVADRPDEATLCLLYEASDWATILESDTPGDAHARNVGIAHARGAWLLFTDADCLVAPDWLRRADAAARRGMLALAGRVPHPQTIPGWTTAATCFPHYQPLDPGEVSSFCTANVMLHRTLVPDGFPPVQNCGDRILSWRLRSVLPLVYDPHWIVHHHPDLSPAAMERRAAAYARATVEAREAEPALPGGRLRALLGAHVAWNWCAARFVLDLRCLASHRTAMGMPLRTLPAVARACLRFRRTYGAVLYRLLRGREALPAPLESKPTFIPATNGDDSPTCVAAIVLQYGGREYLEGCLAAVEGQTRPADVRIVVDNAPGDQSADLVAQRFSSWQYLPQPYNTGCAEGYNIGARAALARGATHLLFLNNDLALEPDALAHLLNAMESDPAAGVCGPVIRDERSEAILSAGGLVDGRETAVRLLRNRPERSDPIDRAWLEGAALLVRAEAFRAAEGFDRRFFAYHEDADLCVRLGCLGWRARLVPEASARHAGSAATGGGYTPARGYLLGRGAAMFAQKHFDRAGRFRFAAWAVAALIGATAREIVTGRGRLASVLAKARGLLDGWRGRPPSTDILQRATDNGQ